MVTLKDITRDNFDDCLNLDVHENQEDFVASTTYSLAESKIFTENIPYVIYDEEEMVGFAMYQKDQNDGQYWITRLLIDKKYQHKGYGRQGLRLLMEKIREQHKPEKVLISFDPENEVARELYRSEGYVDTGRIEDDEIVMEYTY